MARRCRGNSELHSGSQVIYIIHYVFDSNVVMHLHHFCYPERFPSLWKKFDKLEEQDLITATKKVLRGCEKDHDGRFRKWINDNKRISCTPTRREAEYLRSC